MTKIKINKTMICKNAIALVGEEGLEKLNMRKLADRLNIKAASLYNHVKSKSELFDLIQGYLYSHMSDIKNNSDWKLHLTELAHNTRDGLLTNPNLVTLFATRPVITSTALSQCEKSLTILKNAGFSEAKILMIFRNMNVFILGHVLAEVGEPPNVEKDYAEPSIKNIDIDDYPTLKKASSYKTNMNFDKGFKFGLNCMLSGLEKQLNKAR